MIGDLHRGQIALGNARQQIGPACDPQIAGPDPDQHVVPGEDLHQHFRNAFARQEKDEGHQPSEAQHEVEKIPDGLFVHPGLDGTSAPVGFDDADRNLQHALEVLGEEIGRGAGVCNRLGLVDFPSFGRYGVLRSGHGLAGDLDHADRRGGLGVDDEIFAALGGLAAIPFDRHLHVGLAGAEPDFADQDIVDRQFLSVGNDDVVGTACGRGGDAGKPFARFGIGLDGDLGPGPAGTDGDFLAGSRRAPEGGVGLLLQDHVVTEEVGQLHLGGSGSAQQGERKGEEDSFHICAVLLVCFHTKLPHFFEKLVYLQALNRKEFVDTNFSIGDETKNITIECLPDAFDSRIGTLMDLYRAACFSYHLHKEIVPANLRKFNMYLYIFSTGIRGIHSRTTVSQNISEKTEYISDASFDQHILPKKGKTYSGQPYITSSKLIEFHECEFSYNSAATGYNTINDADGFEQKYTIGISYKYAMEQRYNEVLQRVIGDFVLNDFDFKQQSYWSANDAADHNTVPVKDDRVTTGHKDSVLDSNSGSSRPMYGLNADYYESRKNDENLVNKQNPKKIFEDPNKSSLLDPWKRLAKNRLEGIERGVNQIVNAGKGAIESWTDINKLNQSLVTAVDKLTFGNLYSVNMTDIPNRATTFLGNLNSRNVAQRMVNGWTRS